MQLIVVLDVVDPAGVDPSTPSSSTRKIFENHILDFVVFIFPSYNVMLRRVTSHASRHVFRRLFFQEYEFYFELAGGSKVQ